MLYQGNGSEAVSGIYERDRLRRRARKLGLHLVKTDKPSSETPSHSTTHRSSAQPDAHRDSAKGAGNEALDTEFDKCG